MRTLPPQLFPLIGFLRIIILLELSFGRGPCLGYEVVINEKMLSRTLDTVASFHEGKFQNRKIFQQKIYVI